jgi:beta-xylosidase
MKRLLISAAAVLALASCAQNVQQKTFTFEGNPLVRDNYTADPAPMVASDGRLYMFCGHDECFEDRPGYEGMYGFNITEWLCYSTEDMVTWVDHGSIMKPTDFSWAIGEAWASQVVEGRDGKYYFYVSTQCGDPNCKAIGVAVADRPEGPYTDAIGRPLILDSMTDNGARGWWNDIDPTVMIEEDGTPWMSWGNGTCFLVKLNKNMIELDGEIQVLPMENYVEGPWIYKRDGHYYNVYASMGTMGGETISYAMAENIEGPWTFMGEVTGQAKDSFTIHPGVVDYKGKSYLFYHNSTISIDGYGPATGRRSVCFAEMQYNADGTIVPVVQE